MSIKHFEIGELVRIHVERPANCLYLYARNQMNFNYNIANVFEDRLAIVFEKSSRAFYDDNEILLNIMFVDDRNNSWVNIDYVRAI